MSIRRLPPKFLWNFTFGVEDSLVSTVGLISGVAAAGMAGPAVVLTGMVLVFVEAMSMGIGSFLSDQSVEELKKHREISAKTSLPGALVMFFSYLVSGMVPLFPYLIWPVILALPFSIVFTLISLFILGFTNGLRSRVHPTKEGLKMAVFGGTAIAIGILIGQIFKIK